MSKYMLSVHTADDEPREPMTDEEMRQGFALVEAIERDMHAANRRPDPHGHGSFRPTFSVEATPCHRARRGRHA